MFYLLSKNLLSLKKVPLKLPLLDEACRDVPPSAVVAPGFCWAECSKSCQALKGKSMVSTCTECVRSSKGIETLLQLLKRDFSKNLCIELKLFSYSSRKQQINGSDPE